MTLLSTAWTHADVMAVADNDILVLVTLCSSMMVLTSLVGISGVLLNSRPILAAYALLLWPCLVITAECVSTCMKARALAWFGLKKRHGFKSVDMASGILADYWRWRDNNYEQALSTNWQGFVNNTYQDIVPI